MQTLEILPECVEDGNCLTPQFSVEGSVAINTSLQGWMLFSIILKFRCRNFNFQDWCCDSQLCPTWLKLSLTSMDEERVYFYYVGMVQHYAFSWPIPKPGASCVHTRTLIRTMTQNSISITMFDYPFGRGSKVLRLTLSPTILSRNSTDVWKLFINVQCRNVRFTARYRQGTPVQAFGNYLTEYIMCMCSSRRRHFVGEGTTNLKELCLESYNAGCFTSYWSSWNICLCRDDLDIPGSFAH